MARAAAGFLPGPAGTIVRGVLGRGGGDRGRFAPPPRIEEILARPPILVEREATIVRTAQTIPSLPGIDLNLPFHGKPGAGVSVGPLRLGIQETQGGQIMAQSGNGALPMIGPFGQAPEVENVQVRRCPRGMRLAIDGMCYPKQLLAARSKLRAWPAEMRPPITNADRRALNRIDAVRTKVKKMGKKADLKVTNK